MPDCNLKRSYLSQKKYKHCSLYTHQVHTSRSILRARLVHRQPRNRTVFIKKSCSKERSIQTLSILISPVLPHYFLHIAKSYPNMFYRCVSVFPFVQESAVSMMPAGQCTSDRSLGYETKGTGCWLLGQTHLTTAHSNKGGFSHAVELLVQQ